MINRIKGLTTKEQRAISEYKDCLFKEFPRKLKKIVLFGSKARGSATRTSDVDLLVVISRGNKRIFRQIAILTHQPIARYMVDISPIAVNESFFDNWSPLLEHIKKEGKLVWTSKTAKRNISG